MPHLTDAKRLELVALIGIGCSRRAACGYVGCDPATLRYHAERNPQFADQLREAEKRREVAHLHNINEAAKKNWRAAVWALERFNPEDYAPRQPEALAHEQVACLVQQVVVIMADEIHDPAVLDRVRMRLSRLADPVALTEQTEPPAAENPLTPEGEIGPNPLEKPGSKGRGEK